MRSGPSKTLYPTSKLKQGEKVQVLREAPEAKGWLEIKPPPLSFSWINRKHVKMVTETAGFVDVEPSRPAPIRPGSRIIDTEPNREIMKLSGGTAIVVVDRPLTVNGETWLPILPQETEIRYIPAESVSPATVVSTQPVRRRGSRRRKVTQLTTTPRRPKGVAAKGILRPRQIFISKSRTTRRIKIK